MIDPNEQKEIRIRERWAKRLGPFFNPKSPPPPRLRNLRAYYDDMLFLQVMDEVRERRRKIHNHTLDTPQN